MNTDQAIQHIEEEANYFDCMSIARRIHSLAAQGHEYYQTIIENYDDKGDPHLWQSNLAEALQGRISPAQSDYVLKAHNGKKGYHILKARQILEDIFKKII